MKILLFSEGYYVGGVDVFISTIVKYWPNQEDKFVLLINKSHSGTKVIKERLGERIEIVTHTMPLIYDFHQRFVFRNIKLVRSAFTFILRYGFLFYQVYWIRKFLEKNKFDFLWVVNGGYPGGDSCRAATIAWGSVYGNKRNIHNFHNMVTPQRKLESIFEKWIDAKVNKTVCKFITVSNACMQSISLRKCLDPLKNDFIYNGIETAILNNEVPKNDKVRLISVFAVFEERKGHRFLMESFVEVLKKEKNVHLMFCGYGKEEDLQRINNDIKELKIQDYVKVLPFQNNIHDYIRMSTMVIVPSLREESFGLVAAEAMMCKVPLIVSNVGGLPEVVGDCTFCVAPWDVADLTSKILTYLNDEQLRKVSIDKCYVRFATLFTAEKMAKNYYDLLKSFS